MKGIKDFFIMAAFDAVPEVLAAFAAVIIAACITLAGGNVYFTNIFIISLIVIVITYFREKKINKYFISTSSLICPGIIVINQKVDRKSEKPKQQKDLPCGKKNF